MKSRIAIAAAVLGLCLGPAALAAADDEAWIERWVDRELQARARQDADARSIPYGELGGFVGQTVRVVMRDGRERTGTLRSVRGGQLVLRVQAPSGYSQHAIARARIARIERSAAR